MAWWDTVWNEAKDLRRNILRNPWKGRLTPFGMVGNTLAFWDWDTSDNQRGGPKPGTTSQNLAPGGVMPSGYTPPTQRGGGGSPQGGWPTPPSPFDLPDIPQIQVSGAGSEEYLRTLETAQAAARGRLEQALKDAIAQVANRRQLGKEALAELPGRYQQTFDQGRANIAGDTAFTDQAVAAASPFDEGVSSVAASGDPFADALSTIQATYNADVPGLERGADMFFTGQEGLLNTAYGTDLAELEAQRAQQVNQYNLARMSEEAANARQYAQLQAERDMAQAEANRRYQDIIFGSEVDIEKERRLRGPTTTNTSGVSFERGQAALAENPQSYYAKNDAWKWLDAEVSSGKPYDQSVLAALGKYPHATKTISAWLASKGLPWPPPQG